jgi:alkanesulfonate monooxygenase SsuD/methylene tetrahydromethanopterin reductase-like flavin-dependent oxidoreductase (luciferase family)
MVAIIGGEPARFAPLVELYREAFLASGGKGRAPVVGINSHTYVAETAERAADEFFPHYGGMMSRIGRERGWPPMSRMQFDQLRSPRGAVLAGGPREVADKILYEHELFGHQRFLAQMSVGGLPHEQVMRSIELFGTEVAPVVRAEVARREAAAAETAPVA